MSAFLSFVFGVGWGDTNNPSNDALIFDCPPPCGTVISALVLCGLEDLEEFGSFVVGVFGSDGGF